MKSIAAVVLGATGYVVGELLRLIHGHPVLQLRCAVSASRNGEAIGDVFPHLAAAYATKVFSNPYSWADNVDRGIDLALFSAAPHGASADAVDAALEAAGRRNLKVHVVDSSADFRYDDVAEFEKVYGVRHPNPRLARDFFCAIPEHERSLPAAHVGHPGCFATAILLASVPLANSGLTDGRYFVTGITGSTGSGKSPQDGTHHPERHSNLYAYKPLAHRHVPEVERLITKATTRQIAVNFVPQSGPFARGIYVVVQAALTAGASADDIRHEFDRQYADCEFVRVIDGTPRLKNVVASNYAHLGIAIHNDSVVVMCAIDNLVKGAAGGAIQWMNRLWSLPETSGLLTPSPAWT
jgi:N-acetyl-gamma-glutamyl-phosphate reductase